MNQQLTIDLVEKHAIACKEQLSVENCDPNLKFYDQQKGTNADQSCEIDLKIIL